MEYFIGWDVGGWNCERNKNSRDALVVLDANGAQLGSPWRGNLRDKINASRSTTEFIRGMLDLCSLAFDHENCPKATLAIDAPLGFPTAFNQLINRGGSVKTIGSSAENEYLYRVTERRLAREGIQPLSAVKDMIGSQATKAIHAISKFAPTSPEIGVWSDGSILTAIETYPSLYRARLALEKENLMGKEADIADAKICSIVARDFSLQRGTLEPPTSDAPPSEGWIWAPLARNQ